MTCFHPLQGFRSRFRSKSGKYPVTFSSNDGFTDKPVVIACGQCIGCRLERSRQWAVRCVHEAKCYEDNCFITLTYRDDCLPAGNSLVVSDFQNFMKRLRFEFGSGIRFFHCGEYGERFKRPHYHACLFNFDFPDKVKDRVINGNYLYRSDTLERLWPFGYSSIGNLTFDSAAYVARYIMKKHLGKSAWLQYADIDYNTGEVLFERKPEYVTMSRRPGIGKPWLEKFMEETYRDDFIVLDGGVKSRPPKFYDSQFEIYSPSDFEVVKRERVINAKQFASDNTPDRLRVREVILESKLNLLPRNLE